MLASLNKVFLQDIAFIENNEKAAWKSNIKGSDLADEDRFSICEPSELWISEYNRLLPAVTSISEFNTLSNILNAHYNF